MCFYVIHKSLDDICRRIKNGEELFFMIHSKQAEKTTIEQLQLGPMLDISMGVILRMVEDPSVFILGSKPIEVIEYNIRGKQC